jgi:hypothetical protein
MATRVPGDDSYRYLLARQFEFSNSCCNGPEVSHKETILLFEPIFGS